MSVTICLIQPFKAISSHTPAGITINLISCSHNTLCWVTHRTEIARHFVDSSTLCGNVSGFVFGCVEEGSNWVEENGRQQNGADWGTDSSLETDGTAMYGTNSTPYSWHSSVWHQQCSVQNDSRCLTENLPQVFCMLCYCKLEQEVDAQLADINVPEPRNFFKTLPNEVSNWSSVTSDATNLTIC
jgi:hypothetical protein